MSVFNEQTVEQADTEMRAAFLQQMGEPWETALEAKRRIWAMAWGAARVTPRAQISRMEAQRDDAEKRARLLQKQLDQLEGFKAKLQPLLEDKARLDSGCIMTRDRDEFGGDESGDGYINCERRGLDLRAAIDAAMKKDNWTDEDRARLGYPIKEPK